MSSLAIDKAKVMHWGLILIRVGLGLLFIYASLDKIWNPGLFAKAIANYKILPIPLLHISAIMLPWLELLCGLAMVFNRYPRAANMLIGILTSIFIVAILSAMSRGLDFNCGCFSVSSANANIGIGKVIQNIGIIVGVGLLEYQFQKKDKTSKA